MRRNSWVAAIGLISLTLGAAAISGDETRAHGDNIHIGNYYFCDISFQNGVCDRTFQVGTEVVWETFEGGHTIVECNDTFTVCPPPGGFNLGMVTPGNLRFRTFGAPGVYEYWCSFHSDQMRGRIIVQTQPTSSPTPVPTPEPTATAAPPGPTTSASGSTLIPTGQASNAASRTPPALFGSEVPTGGGPGSESSSPREYVLSVLAAGPLLAAAAAIAGGISRSRSP